MNNLFKSSGLPVRDAFFGVFGGIVVAYFLLYFTEIVTWSHHLNFAMLGNLLWLGVGVIVFAFVEQFRKERVSE